MKYEPIKTVLDMVETAGMMKASTVIVAGGDRVEDLSLVESARDHGIIDRIILVGRKHGIEKAVDEIGIEVARDDIVSADDYESVARATVDIVRAGQVDIVLKGNMSTPILNRRMLELAVRPTVSLATVFDAAPIAGGRTMIMTDAGFTTVCNPGRMGDLIRNSADVARTVLGIKTPRVALLSANEKQVPSLRSTWMGLGLARKYWADEIVCGPLSFDLATDPDSVRIKGLPDLPNADKVAGQADILVCPGIDSANILYKNLTALNKYGQASLASITMGFSVPYVIISRADTLETRLVSIALCSIYAQREKEPETVSQVIEETKYRILVINPGSTSLKAAIYENDRIIEEYSENFDFPADVTIDQQADGLVEIIEDKISGNAGRIDAIAARGGFVGGPGEGLKAGVYVVAEADNGNVEVQQDIISACSQSDQMFHASSLAVPTAARLARKLRVSAYTVNPVVVDEFDVLARYSGFKGIERKSICHALSIKAAAVKIAEQVGRSVEDMDLVVVHLGGGVSIASVKGGRIVDCNMALLGDGPFAVNRTGQLPMGDLIDLCCCGKYSRDQVIDLLTSKGGLLSYLDTSDMNEIERRIDEGDSRAEEVIKAMVYQIAKSIGSAFVAVDCQAEAIVITGGLANSKRIVKSLRKYAGRLAPVYVIKDALENEALASGVLEILKGIKKANIYKK